MFSAAVMIYTAAIVYKPTSLNDAAIVDSSAFTYRLLVLPKKPLFGRNIVLLLGPFGVRSQFMCKVFLLYLQHVLYSWCLDLDDL